MISILNKIHKSAPRCVHEDQYSCLSELLSHNEQPTNHQRNIFQFIQMRLANNCRYLLSSQQFLRLLSVYKREG